MRLWDEGHPLAGGTQLRLAVARTMVMVAAATLCQEVVTWMKGKVGEEGLQGQEIT